MAEENIAGGGQANNPMPPTGKSKNHIGAIIIIVLILVLIGGIFWISAVRNGGIGSFIEDRIGQNGNPGPADQKFAVVGFIESIDKENFTIGLLEENTGESYMINFDESNGLVLVRGGAIDFEEMQIGMYVSVTSGQLLGADTRMFETFRINVLPGTGGTDFSVPANSQ